MKLDILCFGAHPDDVELGCGGTIIKEISLGRKIGIIDLTRGELGTRGTVVERDRESNIASSILGIHVRENMNFKDGFFKDDQDHKLSLVKKIREYRPDIVITNAPSDRHPDHPRSSQITVDACFLSGLEKINTNQQIWRPKNIFHYIQYNNISPDIVVNISDFIDQKIKAVKAYKSQFYNPDSSEAQTVISTKSFLDSIKYRAQDLGRLSNCDYAEGFVANQLMKLNSLLDFK